jgi:hypothetical protein
LIPLLGIHSLPLLGGQSLLLNAHPRIFLILFLIILFHVVVLILAILALLPFHVFYIRFTQGGLGWLACTWLGELGGVPMEEGLEGNGEAGSRIREEGMVVVVFWRKRV